MRFQGQKATTSSGILTLMPPDRNSRNTTEQRRNTGITAEHRNNGGTPDNGTPEKLKPEHLQIERVRYTYEFGLDSLNALEEEWKVLRAFAQINLSLLIAYFFSMLSEIGHIILELGGCEGWALTSTPSPMLSRNPNQTSQVSYSFNL